MDVKHLASSLVHNKWTLSFSYNIIITTIVISGLSCFKKLFHSIQIQNSFCFSLSEETLLQLCMS